MESYDHHFIDSNVILGFIIGWDSLRSRSINYFYSIRCERYGSDNVFEECERVLSKNKIWIKQFVNQLNKECKLKSSIDFNGDLLKIRRKVIKKISAQYPSENKKINNVIKQFSKTHLNLLINIMKGEMEGGNLLKQIDTAFFRARRNLIKVFRSVINKKQTPQNLKTTLFLKYRKLITAEKLHSKDISILLDSHYISTRYARRVIAFVTFDKGIIESKNIIEGQLGIKIFKPY